MCVTLPFNVDVRVTLQEQPASISATGPAHHPRVGVMGWDALSQALDSTDKVDVVSSAHLRTTGAPAVNSAPQQNQLTNPPVGGATEHLDGFTRSEARELVTHLCAENQLNYLFVASAGQNSTNVDATAMFFGLGRMRDRVSQEVSLYQCPSMDPVWQKNMTIEGSNGVMRMALGGGIGSGGSETDHAAAVVVATRMVTDMGW